MRKAKIKTGNLFAWNRKKIGNMIAAHIQPNPSPSHVQVQAGGLIAVPEAEVWTRRMVDDSDDFSAGARFSARTALLTIRAEILEKVR